MHTDSRSFYGLSILLAQTTERQFKIYIDIIREAYEHCSIIYIIWISENLNLKLRLQDIHATIVSL